MMNNSKQILFFAKKSFMKKTTLTTLALSAISIATLKAQQLPGYVPALQLKAWYSFTGDYNDLSGNNNHATNYGTEFAPDRCQNANAAVYFDGNYKKLVIQNSILPDTPTSFTIAFWVKRAPTPGTGKDIIADRGNVNYDHKYRITVSTPNSSAPHNYSYCMHHHKNTEFKYPVTTPVTSEWQHVAVVYDRNLNQNYIYTDGNLMITNNLPVNVYPQTQNPTWIGGIDIPPGGPSYLDAPFKGYVDDLGFWSRALNVKEIINLANADCNDTTSIKTNKFNNKLHIYPNPANRKITIENTAFTGNPFSIKIINNTGQEIYKDSFKSEKINIELPETIATGVYYIYLIADNQLQSVKEISIK